MLKSRQTAPQGASRPLLPYATPGHAGAGGRIKAIPEDFRVEELPAYAFSGEGEHLYLLIEKTGRSTVDVAERLAGLCGVPLEAVGYAGRKDTWAVTRQWYSVYRGMQAPIADLLRQGLRVLRETRHRNKLRLGHLRGNAFQVVIRGVDPGVDVAPLVEWMTTNGFPNFFGPQRFGPGFRTALQGRERFLRGRFGRHGSAALRYQESAYQSALFNDLLAARLSALGSLARLLPGDLAQLHRNAALFPVAEDDLDAVQARADAGDLCASLPLVGAAPPWADGWQGQLEQQLLEREGLDSWRTDAPHRAPPGERRAVRAFPQGLHVTHDREAGEPILHLRFRLDRGVFATALLREVMRNDHLAYFGAPLHCGTPAPGI